jgi:lipopolysaccharide assembly outer membrane protein LptD (OstA)
MRLCRFVILLLFSVLLLNRAAFAQETDRPADLPSPADSLRVEPPDTSQAARADTLQPPGNVPAPPVSRAERGNLDEPVESSASDSLVIIFSDSTGDVGTLYGQAAVKVGSAELSAHRIDIFFDIDELRATGLSSDTGLVGRPQFVQDGESFAGNELAFNLRTERGRIIGARTAMQDGFIQAGIVKVTEDSTIFVADGAYTTCDCEDDPSYTLRSKRMKIVDQEWIYTGPIQLYLFNIPTPFWLPFGFLPAREGRRSGPLPPRYGEDDRGFYLRGWGWYQALSDYTDFQIEFGLWTLGSWQVAPQFRYARRYAYRGQVGIDYGRSRSGEKDDPNFQVFSTTSIRWTHSQEINPTSSFNANVNLSSRNYLRSVSEQYDDRVRQTIQSSVRYSKSWRESGRNLSVDLNHRQQLATGDVSATLPSLSFSQRARKPFQRESRSAGSSERWYERITYTYGSSVDNRYTFDPLEPSQLIGREDSASVADISWLDALFSPDRYRRATGRDAPFEFKASHRLSSSASFTMNRIPVIRRNLRLNIAPNFNYTEDWFLRTERQHADPETGRLERSSVSDWLALRQFSTGISSNTTFYGIFPVRVGPFQGLRHTVRPSLSFNYRPDFFDPFWGYTDTYVDASGREVRYGLVTGVQRGRQQALSFSLNNVFETKRVRPDTTDQPAQSQRTIQLLNLDLNTSYNFAADSFKLAPFRLSARTRILDQVDLRVTSTFSPYALSDDRSQEINRFLFQENRFALARLTQFNVSLNTRFESSPSGADRPISISRTRGTDSGFDSGIDFATDLPYESGTGMRSSMYNTSVGYADFAIPWSLSVSMTYNYFRRFERVDTLVLDRGDFNAILNTNFDFNLTPNWKVQGRSGYDFKQQELVYTSLAILRDFECWEMGISWVPFGPYQSYGFDLHVKSGHLRDLLRIRQPRSDVRGRFGAAGI